MTNLKLGRKAVKTDTRTLKLGKYLTDALPVPPVSVDWHKNVSDFGLMRNGDLGDCTICGCAHAEQIWTVNAYPRMSTISDSDVLKYYIKWCGYDPGDPSTDQGGIELDVLNHWRKEGFAGRHILGYADAAVNNLTEIRQSIALFGGVYIGMQVPNFIMNNIPALWEVTENDGGIDGGHCVYVCGYDANTLTFISWGKLYRMTVLYWNKYVDEAHTILGCGWINNKKSPSGFDMEQLLSDLKAIR